MEQAPELASELAPEQVLERAPRRLINVIDQDNVDYPYINPDNEVVLSVVKKVMPKTDSTIFVTDMNNNIIFKAEDRTEPCSFRKKRVLLDAGGDTILTFRSNLMSMHYRWRVYRGESNDDNHIIFTAKRSNMIRCLRKHLKVFLRANRNETLCDYKVRSSREVFCVGNNNEDIIARTEDYMVRVDRNVDQAFIVALIVILDGIDQQSKEDRERSGSCFSNGINIAGAIAGS